MTYVLPLCTTFVIIPFTSPIPHKNTIPITPYEISILIHSYHVVCIRNKTVCVQVIIDICNEAYYHSRYQPIYHYHSTYKHNPTYHWDIQDTSWCMSNRCFLPIQISLRLFCHLNRSNNQNFQLTCIIVKKKNCDI